MLSVIVDARTDARLLPALLSQLTTGAVDGLVRQVLIVAGDAQTGVGELCEEMGADMRPTIEAAATAARAEWLMVLPADFRLQDGWIAALDGHLAGCGVEAVVHGLAPGGLFRRRPFGVLVERRRLEGRNGADLQRLRRELGLAARRIG